jgi:hypothetical protein
MLWSRCNLKTWYVDKHQMMVKMLSRDETKKPKKAEYAVQYKNPQIEFIIFIQMLWSRCNLKTWYVDMPCMKLIQKALQRSKREAYYY